MFGRTGTKSTALPAASGVRTVRGVRQAGLFYLIMGAAALGAYLIPGSRQYHRAALMIVIALVLAVAALTRTRLANVLTGYRSLILPTLGLTLIAASNAEGVIDPVSLGLCYVLLFLWIGHWHPPGTSIRFLPVALLAYLLPYAAGAPSPGSTAASALLVMAASIMVAEVVARQTHSARLAWIKQGEALKALSDATERDDLTGIGNRRLGNQLLADLAAHDAVVILDLDQFKFVNDTLGHSRGDQLLQEFGDFLREHVPHIDHVARMGGEEFLLVVKDTTEQEALAVAARLVEVWRDTDPLVTMSAGVAVHQAEQEPSATYAQADTALYAAKEHGRDRARLASPSDASSLVRH